MNLKEKDIVVLYKLLVQYEQRISKLTSDESLYREFAQYSGFWKRIPKNLIVPEKAEKMPKSKDIPTKGDVIVMTKSKKTKLLSFINHLRNAFAHGTIVTDGSFVIFSDYNKNRKRFSALGKIKQSTFNEILKLIK